MTKLYKSTLMAATLAMALTSAQGRTVAVVGSIMDSNSNGSIYQITSDGDKSLMTAATDAYSNYYSASGGGTYNDGTYYLSKNNSGIYNTYVFNAAETPWVRTGSAGGSAQVACTDMSYDTGQNVIYGFNLPSGTNYGKIRLITPSASDWSSTVLRIQVADEWQEITIDCTDPENKWHGLAFDSENQLWVITFGGQLNKVDKTNGKMTLIGDTGIKPAVNGSAAFDLKTGKLYWAVKNDDGSCIYEVNTEDATTTKVMDVPENKQMMGIYIPAPLAEDDAPSTATNLRYDFTDGSLTGNLVFEIPSTTFNGDEATGPVSYSVTIGADEPLTGDSEFGQIVTVPVTVAQSGMVSATVVLSNDAGSSPVAKLEGYIGYGVPIAPANVSLAYEEGMMNLTWEAVTEVVNGDGFLGSVKYKVTRKLGEDTSVVAEDLIEISYQEEASEPETGIETYVYTVEAYNEEFTSTGNNSVQLALGSAALPYTNEFNTIDEFNEMTAINCQPASKTWVYNSTSKNVTLAYDKAYAKDDYLIAPPVKLQKDHTYKVSVSAKSQTANYPEKITLKWGLEPTAEAMENTIFESENLPTAAEVYSATFTPESDITAYIAVQACSPEDMSTLTIDDFEIKEEIKEDITVGVGAINEDIPVMTVEKNIVTIKGAGLLTVMTIDGVVVEKMNVDSEAAVELNSGMYIISFNGKAVKTLVR